LLPKRGKGKCFFQSRQQFGWAFWFLAVPKKDQACAGETQARIESDFRLQEKLASEREMITASTLSFTMQKSNPRIN